MGTKRLKVRTCDHCGQERSYEPEDCDSYYNRWGKQCLAPPKDDMLVLSIPDGGGRKFLDFCNMECLRAYVANAAGEAALPAKGDA